METTMGADPSHVRGAGGFLPRNAYSATPGPPAQGWGHGWLSSRACLNAAQDLLPPVLVVGGRPPKTR